MKNSMLKVLMIVAVLALGAVFSLPAAHADLITNGSFELGTPSDGSLGFTTVNAGNSTTITGWTVTANSVDWIGSYWTASAGARSIDLTGTPGNGILASTTFATTAGVTYKVLFDLSGNFVDTDATDRTVEVQATGGALTDFTFTKPGTWSQTNMGWVATEYDFTASGVLTTLTFESESLDAYRGPAIDNVSVNAVPLPPSVLLLGTGILGLVGLRLRRKSA